MNVEYRNQPPVLLPNLNDEELAQATREYILDRIPDVVSAEITRKPYGAEMAQAQNRHERRRAAKLEGSA